ncbi:MAG: 2-hydroxychromene-2-carboxylate isomerase, partial [Oleispira sp.]
MKNTLQKIIKPYGAGLISSNGLLKLKRQVQETKRKLLSRPHLVELYLRINDPYSYLLVQVLADFEQRFDVQMQFRTIFNLQQDMYPETELWHVNGFLDATHLATLYKLKWPTHAPSNDARRIQQGSYALLQIENQSRKSTINDWAAVEQIFKDYWFPQPTDGLYESLITHNTLDEAACSKQLRANEQALLEQGHYMSAMLYYAGEWYWGLDRLDHLEARLLLLGLGEGSEVRFDQTYRNFCKTVPLSAANPNSKKLTLYFSIRSPYSHLGLHQAIKLAQHYQLALEIKPVLPMVMRGLLVPDTKKMYIFHDTKREAVKLGIDYGFVADPLGEGVKRCYALFEYAQSLGK